MARMLPIHELLSRIRWDASFGSANFALGYHDRHEGGLLVVPLREVRFPTGEAGAAPSFELIDGDGELRRIPLHRIKQVYRDGELIWAR